MRFTYLVAAALYELVAYEIGMTVRGFGHVRRRLADLPVHPRRTQVSPEDLERISAAMTWALMLHWRQVQCLQRSIVMARLLRRSGIAGRVLIGFRDTPFFCHAWVEVDGAILDDSPRYREALQILDAIGIPDVPWTGAVYEHSLIQKIQPEG